MLLREFLSPRLSASAPRQSLRQILLDEENEFRRLLRNMLVKQRSQLKVHQAEFEKLFFKRYEHFQSKLLNTVEEHVNLDMWPESLNFGTDADPSFPFGIGIGERGSAMELGELRPDMRGAPLPAQPAKSSLSVSDPQSETAKRESVMLDSVGSIKERGDSLREARKPSFLLSAGDSSWQSDMISNASSFRDDPGASRCRSMSLDSSPSSPHLEHTLSPNPVHSIVKRGVTPGSLRSGNPSLTSFGHGRSKDEKKPRCRRVRKVRCETGHFGARGPFEHVGYGQGAQRGGCREHSDHVGCTVPETGHTENMGQQLYFPGGHLRVHHSKRNLHGNDFTTILDVSCQQLHGFFIWGGFGHAPRRINLDTWHGHRLQRALRDGASRANGS